MPEYPEVETLRRNLSRTLPGRVIAAVDLCLPKLLQPAPGLGPADLVGRTVQGLRRRGKVLIIDLSDGLSLVLHLKLTGQIVLVDASGQVVVAGGHPVPAFGSPLPHKATHLILTFTDGSRLFLTDLRQFARVFLVRTVDVPALPVLQGLGPDPFDPDLTPEAFARRLRQRARAPLKAVLLDQRVLAGLGNIYSDEALFLAGLHPLRPAGQLSDAEAERLLQAIREVLTYAVTYGVAQVINGRAVRGRPFPRVHGRAGEPCPRCGTPIVKITVGGRGTYLCPRCQPLAVPAPAGVGRADPSSPV